MKLSTRTRYGLRAILELAENYGQGPLRLRIIAERQEISVKYLEQLMADSNPRELSEVLGDQAADMFLLKAPTRSGSVTVSITWKDLLLHPSVLAIAAFAVEPLIVLPEDYGLMFRILSWSFCDP